MAHTLFISDLHLQEDEPQTVKIFLNFLEMQAPEADALYILGDFFETWIGDDDRCSFNRKIIAALRSFAEKGIPLYFMRGNRDFLIGNKFATSANVFLLEDPCVINLYGNCILLTHGDILCTLDHRHQNYRKLVMKPWLQKSFLMLPLSIRRKLANQLRKTSKNRGLQTPYRMMDVTSKEVEGLMTKYHVNLMIHGHTHRPDIHDLRLANETAKRIVLGAWHDEGNALIYHDDGSFEWLGFSC